MEGAWASPSCLTENTVLPPYWHWGLEQARARAGTAVNQASVPSCLSRLGMYLEHTQTFTQLSTTPCNHRGKKTKVKESFYALCSLASALEEGDRAPDPKVWPLGTGQWWTAQEAVPQPRQAQRDCCQDWSQLSSTLKIIFPLCKNPNY